MKAILYVWGQHEKNSASALEIGKQTKALDYMSIVDVRNLRCGDIPEWLTGVPTVLTTGTSGDDATVFKGTAALQKIQQISNYTDDFEAVVVEAEEMQQQPMQNVQGVGQVHTRQMTMPRGMESNYNPWTSSSQRG